MRRLFSSAAIGVLLLPATWFVLVGQAPTLPGTSADHIGFPANYKSTFKQLYVLDNNQNQQVRAIWANDIAQTVDPNQPWNFPYGSVLLFEDYPTVPDANGNPPHLLRIYSIQTCTIVSQPVHQAINLHLRQWGGAGTHGCAERSCRA